MAIKIYSLKRDGSTKLTIDGNFGVLVKAAMLRFQKNKKLTHDGIVGVKTRAALKKAVI